MARSLISGATLLLAVLALAGCGVRGSLDLPQEAKAEQAEANKIGPDGKAPHKPFILDRLLR